MLLASVSSGLLPPGPCLSLLHKDSPPSYPTESRVPNPSRGRGAAAQSPQMARDGHRPGAARQVLLKELCCAWTSGICITPDPVMQNSQNAGGGTQPFGL